MDKMKLNVKQVLLTASVTCVFTIIAGVGTYVLTSRSAALSYTVSSGPVLSSGQTHKRIYSLVMENSGRKEVDAPTLQVQIVGGTISEVASDPPAGLSSDEFKTNETYRISVPSLNPGEQLSASLMLSLVDPGATPTITVRGRGVNGHEVKQKKSGRTDIAFLLAGASASVIGAMLSVSPAMRKIIGRPLWPSAVARAFMGPEGTTGPFDRNELIALICGLSGLPDHARQLRFAPSEVSFRGAADFLTLEGLSAASQEARQRFGIALQSMLLIASISKGSVDVIQQGAMRVASIDYARCLEIRKHAVDEDHEPARLRKVLIDYIQSGAKDLPQPAGTSGA